MRTAWPPRSRLTTPRLSRRGVLSLVLVAAVLASLVAVVAVDPADRLLNRGGFGLLAEIVTSVVRPDLSPAFLARVGRATMLSVAYAVAGTTVAVVIGLPGALLASGVLARGRRLRLASVTAARGLLAVPRAVHELVWALLFVEAFGLSPWAGILAIGVPYGAIIARVLAERLQDVPPEPLEALRTTGASQWQLLVFGRVPQVGPDVAAYLFYRFECAVRAAAILSFVGLGGIGLEVDVALADLRFERVWTLLFALVLVIVAIDVVSARLRARVVAGSGPDSDAGTAASSPQEAPVT